MEKVTQKSLYLTQRAPGRLGRSHGLRVSTRSVLFDCLLHWFVSRRIGFFSNFSFLFSFFLFSFLSFLFFCFVRSFLVCSFLLPFFVASFFVCAAISASLSPLDDYLSCFTLLSSFLPPQSSCFLFSPHLSLAPFPTICIFLFFLSSPLAFLFLCTVKTFASRTLLQLHIMAHSSFKNCHYFLH